MGRVRHPLADGRPVGIPPKPRKQFERATCAVCQREIPTVRVGRNYRLRDHDDNIIGGKPCAGSRRAV